MSSLATIVDQIRDPQQEIELVRKGIAASTAEKFLTKHSLVIKDILISLDVSSSTYFALKKKKKPLNSSITEKFLRLIQTVMLAQEILGQEKGVIWMKQEIPALGNQQPINLLDTEPGHKLVEQSLLQIKYGMYS